MPDIKDKKDGVSLDEVIKAGSWLQRNIGRAIGWFNYFKSKFVAKSATVLLLTSFLGGCQLVRIIGNLPDIPVPPGVPTRPPVVSVTPTPSPEPRIDPTQTPIPSPTVTPSPLSSATPSPIPSPTPFCIFRPDNEPVTIAYRGNCPKHLTDLTWNTPVPPGFDKVCGLNWGRWDIDNTAWRLGKGSGSEPQKFPLVIRKGVYMQLEITNGKEKCIDALGRTFTNCDHLVEVGPEYEDPIHEQYAASGYLEPPYCEDQIQATPTPMATPGPSPTPSNRTNHCTCQVICTARFLGWNDNQGLPPTAVIGGQASIDITCRQAQFPGDQRGQPVDRSNGPEWCEPRENPVLWDISTPGVREHFGNDGYRLDLQDLQSGNYSIRVRPNPNAVYRNGEPIALCPWGHNDSVKDFVEFGL